ncbi:hypothetical protein RDWZM_002811 [Blomia tropicalis]|uniref:Uncharacterized protein n=1 Tax=Blomia tropicalis TaxID=40697 RepID=A0A9Q0ME59_BLOTA|nr:hypothetical protein RDWZM_002811 [Blomia tropicalis]
MRTLIILSLATIILASTAIACNYDSDCGPNGRCVNNLCLVSVECNRNLDCLNHGLYFECDHGRCVTSKHKICRSDDDCKKNLIHKRCIHDRCST